jgi:hypothetical protein
MPAGSAGHAPFDHAQIKTSAVRATCPARCPRHHRLGLRVGLHPPPGLAGAIAPATSHAKVTGSGGGPKPPTSPRPGRGRTVLHLIETVLRHRGAKARGKAVPFLFRAYRGGARGPCAPPDGFRHAGEWGENAAILGDCHGFSLSTVITLHRGFIHFCLCGQSHFNISMHREYSWVMFALNIGS